MRMGLRVIVLIRETLKVEQLAGVIKLQRQAGSPLSSIILRPRVLVRPESNSHDIRELKQTRRRRKRERHLKM